MDKGPLSNIGGGKIVTNYSPPADQGGCNSCWAISACQALSDRLRYKGIIHNDELNYYLFHDYVVKNTPQTNGCYSGAKYSTALDKIESVGSPLMSETKDRDFDHKYINSDVDKYHYRASNVREIDPENVVDELESGGTLISIINLFPSLSYFYPRGNNIRDYIYTPKYSESEDESLAHMLSLIGYIILDDNMYWIYRNSYGLNWGLEGLFLANADDDKLHGKRLFYVIEE